VNPFGMTGSANRRGFLAGSAGLVASAASLSGGEPVAEQAATAPADRPLSAADRPDGRFLTTAGFVQHHLKHLRPRLAFDPTFSVAEAEAWRNEVRGQLRRLLNFPDVPPQPEPRLVAQEPRRGYTLQRWELYPEPYSVVPFLMLVPDDATPQRPAPAVLCFPGSDHPKEATCGEPWNTAWQNKWGEHNFMARHVVRQGMIALAFDNPSTAELDDPRVKRWYRQSWELIWLNRSYTGLSVFQKHVALQWLKTRAHVDAARIAVAGHSLGAEPALMLGVLDPDIKAVIWNNQASSWRQELVAKNLYSFAPWHYIPDFINWFDYTDLMAALAPTPLMLSEGGRTEDHALIRRAYELSGAARNLAIHFMPGYADEKDCLLDKEPLPEGITEEQYARYANYGPEHYFKDEQALPWLCEILRG